MGKFGGTFWSHHAFARGRGRIIGLLIATGLVVGLGACSETEKATEIGASPVVDPHYVPIDLRDPEPPPKYGEMVHDNSRGAAAAARYFMDLHGYTYSSGDTQIWDEASGPQCVICEHVTNEVTEVYEAEGSYAGMGLVHGTARTYYPSVAEPYFIVSLYAHFEGFTQFDAAGEIVEWESPSEYYEFAVALKYVADDEWQLLGFDPREDFREYPGDKVIEREVAIRAHQKPGWVNPDDIYYNAALDPFREQQTVSWYNELDGSNLHELVFPPIGCFEPRNLEYQCINTSLSEAAEVDEPSKVDSETSDYLKKLVRHFEALPLSGEIVSSEQKPKIMDAGTEIPLITNPEPQEHAVTIDGTPYVFTAIPVHYRWKMGDGNQVATTNSGNGSEAPRTYQYQTPGTHTVTLYTTWEGSYTSKSPGQYRQGPFTVHATTETEVEGDEYTIRPTGLGGPMHDAK